MDQKPKSCERSSSTPNQNSFGESFPRAMRGRKWSRFYFFCHFDFTPWPAYCSLLTAILCREGLVGNPISLAIGLLANITLTQRSRRLSSRWRDTSRRTWGGGGTIIKVLMRATGWAIILATSKFG